MAKRVSPKEKARLKARRAAAAKKGYPDWGMARHASKDWEKAAWRTSSLENIEFRIRRDDKMAAAARALKAGEKAKRDARKKARKVAAQKMMKVERVKRAERLKHPEKHSEVAKPMEPIKVKKKKKKRKGKPAKPLYDYQGKK